MPFLIFTVVAFGTGEGLLRYGIRIRCSKRLPWVRDAFSETFGVKNRLLRYRKDIRCAKTPFWGTRCVFKDTRCAKTGFSGTERIFGARTPPPTVRNEATGYDYCVAGSGWKMRPLPTTRCTPNPIKFSDPIEAHPNHKNHLDPTKAHPNTIKLTKPTKTTPTPQKPPCPIKAKRPTDSRRPTLRLCTKT